MKYVYFDIKQSDPDGSEKQKYIQELIDLNYCIECQGYGQDVGNGLECIYCLGSGKYDVYEKYHHKIEKLKVFW